MMGEDLTGPQVAGRILVIDDEEPVVEAIGRMLEVENYEVQTALNGVEGVELFKAGRHDLVLTDLRLGDIPGTEVLRQVKKIDPNVAVIILTGYATTESAVEAIKLGADDYLTKPVRMSELSMAVRNQISAVKLQERVRTLNEEVAGERDKLRKSVAEIGLLKRLASKMMSALNYLEGFELLVSFLVEEIDADIAAIYDLERGTLKLTTSAAPSKNELESLSALLNHYAKGLGYSTDIKPESFTGETACAIADPELELVSNIVLPVYLEGRLFALLVAASRNDPNFHKTWDEFARKIAAEASDFLLRVKRSVEHQQHWASAIVEHTLDGLVVIDASRQQFLVNPVARSILEIPAGKEPTREMVEDRLGLKLVDLTDELAKLKESADAKRTAVRHVELFWRGQQAYVRVNASSLPGDGKSDAGEMLLVLQDVTMERSVEEMKAKLMSNISHELRTPTAVVKEFISLILDGVAGDLSASQRQYIQIMQSNVERLSRLIENLLTLARSDTGGFTIILRPLELVPVIESVAQSLSVKLNQKRMTIELNLPHDLPLVYADRDALTQIITNIIENARKYSPNDTTVTVTAVGKGPRVEIAVADEGFGIPASEHEAIFKRFHRLVDKDDPRFQEGVGLGLPLVKDLVNRHGGDIWLTSEVGKGSTFFVSLQVAHEDEEFRPA